MSARPALDVSDLPELSFGHGANVWWGVLCLLAIEGTMFALLAASYFYLRQAALDWPPPPTPWPSLGVPTANLLVLVGSVLPMAWVHRRALRLDRRAVAAGLAVCTLFSMAAVVLRVVEFRALHVRWDMNAYGSIVWMILGMHTGHLVTSTIENVLVALVMFSRGLEDKHFVDATVNAVYWYFVVCSWVPLYAIVFLVPRWV
jgi:heme/copper-type cytochrome/quinol oxidase subunit 3